MLSPDTLESWCKNVGVLPHARALIDQIRRSDPARRVGSGRSNVSGRYPSRKMGVTIQFESHRVELAGIYEMEHDAEVLEFYDQPIQIKLNYETPSGKPLAVRHTPDFFVIRNTAAGWEEWKTEEDLLRLAEQSPNRYRSADNDQWRCPPGEACAKEFGFYYRVRSSREINWVYQRNIQFLEDYLRSDLPIRPESHERVRALVSARSAIDLSDLFQETMGIVSRDELFAMIAVGQGSRPSQSVSSCNLIFCFERHRNCINSSTPAANGSGGNNGGESTAKADPGVSGRGAIGGHRSGPNYPLLATTIPASRGSPWRRLSRSSTSVPRLRKPE
jgi:TnsA endonuclease N terminal